jgi:hypothetical protein
MPTYTWPLASIAAGAETTVADIIRMALRRIGALASEESPSAAEEQDALLVLNDMLDSWAGERLNLFATLRSTHALTPSLDPHTIGASGTFTATRPIRVDAASIIPASALGTETPLTILSDAEWQALQGKTAVGTPIYLWVDSAYPLMKLHLNPIPSAADTLVLYTWQQIGRFASTATAVDFPPGYARAIVSNLAIELAPEFGLSAPAELANTASESKANIKRLNMQPSYLRCDAAVLRAGGLNLISGDE